MTKRIHRARFDLGKWLSDFDTRLSESYVGVNAICVGLLANATMGAPPRAVAPNLNGTMNFLSHDVSMWGTALICAGVLVFIGLAIGTRRPETTWPRAWIAWMMTMFYIVIAIGSYQQPGGFALCPIYAATAFWSGVNTLILLVETMVQRQTTRIESHSERVVDRCMVKTNASIGQAISGKDFK